MIDMDPTPAPTENTNIVTYSFCTEEEQQQRLNICKECTRFWISQENRTYCLEESKSISYMISEKQITCPLGKW